MASAPIVALPVMCMPFARRTPCMTRPSRTCPLLSLCRLWLGDLKRRSASKWRRGQTTGTTGLCPNYTEVKLIFKEVDSPAAWTAQKHGCHLVENLTVHNNTNPVLNSIVRLRRCNLPLGEGVFLGASMRNGWHARAECKIQKCVLYSCRRECLSTFSPGEACHSASSDLFAEMGRSCHIANHWDLPIWKASASHRHGAQVDLNAMLETVAKFGEDGLAFLQEMKIRKS